MLKQFNLDSEKVKKAVSASARYHSPELLIPIFAYLVKQYPSTASNLHYEPVLDMFIYFAPLVTAFRFLYSVFSRLKANQ